MYMNAGTQDAGLDADWDPITRQWKGWKKPNNQNKSAEAS
jgi:hypothetical protein